MAGLSVKESSMLISRASKAWKYLHGTINVYKPAGMRTPVLMDAIKINLCKGEKNIVLLFGIRSNIKLIKIYFMESVDLNSMELDEPKPLLEIRSTDNKNYSVQLVQNLAQDILATGRRYTEDMLKIAPAHYLGVHTSGVMGMRII